MLHHALEMKFTLCPKGIIIDGRGDCMPTGEKIALLRKKKGLTQEALSEQLDVSRQSVSRWTDKLIKLSKMFVPMLRLRVIGLPRTEKRLTLVFLARRKMKRLQEF